MIDIIRSSELLWFRDLLLELQRDNVYQNGCTHAIGMPADQLVAFYTGTMAYCRPCAATHVAIDPTSDLYRCARCDEMILQSKGDRAIRFDIPIAGSALVEIELCETCEVFVIMTETELRNEG